MFSMETETAKVWKSHFRPAIVFISFAHVLLTKGQARTGRNGITDYRCRLPGTDY